MSNKVNCSIVLSHFQFCSEGDGSGRLSALSRFLFSHFEDGGIAPDKIAIDLLNCQVAFSLLFPAALGL